MRRLIFALVLLGMLAGCGKKGISPWHQPFYQDIPATLNAHNLAESEVDLRIVYLLPLTGSSAKVGEAFLNAALMAQFDLPDHQIETFFIDTKGTEAGTLDALEQVRDKNPDVILGPVFSAEVKAVQEAGTTVPVISFTSDNAVLGNGVYTTALLIPEQVDTMVQYACDQGKRRLAVLGAENKVGELTLNTLQQSIKKCPGMVVEKIALYNPKDVNLAPAVLKVSPKQIDPKKKNLTEAEQAELAKPIAERVDFDVLLVAEEGVKLKQVMSLLSYYDMTPRDVMTIGLSGAAAQGKDKSVRGMYFPAMPIRSEKDFEQLYQAQFGKKPMPVAAYGYDAFMMAVFLKSKGALTEEGIANVGGYKGINGLVRLNKDGTNNRLLDIYQINPYGRPQLVEPARANFEEVPQQWFWNTQSTQSIADAQEELERQKKQVQEEMMLKEALGVEEIGTNERTVKEEVISEDVTPASEEESGY